MERQNHITMGQISDALMLAEEALDDKIPFKHKELDEASDDKRFQTVWECVAFRLGAMWAIKKIYSHKTSAEIMEEMECPIITCDYMDYIRGCFGCEYCRLHADQIEWEFYGCHHNPYKGKCITEIEQCPKKNNEYGND